MSGVNKVILVGNTGKEFEFRTFESGKKVANTTLATSEKFKDKNGEMQEVTEWHNLVFYGPIVDVLEKWGKKGMQLYVEGKLKTRSYEKDGDKRYITEIIVKETIFLGKKGSDSSENSNWSTGSNDDTDDLPF